MKVNSVNLAQMSKEKSLRSDCVYQNLASKRYSSKEEYYTFNELFQVVESKVYYKDIVGEFRYCQIGDVGKDGVACPVNLNFDERDLLDESYYKKIEKGDIMSVDEDDILVSFLLPQDSSILGKFTYIRENDKDIFFSTAFLRIKAKLCPQIMFYCLQSLFYNELVSIARIRKGYTGYATLSKDDLKDMRFGKNIIDAIIKNENMLTEVIAGKEREIDNLRSTTISEQDIIDSVFHRNFGFNDETFKELKRHKTYTSKQAMFSNNPDLRFSVKYHRPAGRFIMEQLTGITDKKIKHFLAEPIVLGASISPKDFNEDGEAYYVSMASIKTLEVVLDETQLVSPTYYENNMSKSLRKGDIIIARSGVAIGKIAIVEEDFDGIFADFTMRIRFDSSRYNPSFAYYYLRSKYFQYLIEVYKKGLQNQNIFPIVVREFPIPDTSLTEQQRIVDRIRAEIAKHREVNDQISRLRNQIESIIPNTICA